MPDQLAPRFRPSVSSCLVLLVLAAVVASGKAAVAASESRKTPIVRAVERVRDSVVNIKGEKTVPAAGSQAGASDARRVNGMGTGVIIDHRGYILTNFHVVDGVREIQVTSADGKRYVAKLVARDPETDLAIIKIDAATELPVIPVGTSSDLMAGETVIAVGNAYGYEHTVTEGIISALHRPVQVSDAQFYDDLIQTSASINPGNSGGPLLNIDGEMIGINVAVRAGAQGIGFAIPVDKAMAVAAKLLASVNSQNVWHGLTIADDKPDGCGVSVAAVAAKSPAAESGLSPGDVIIKLGDQPVNKAVDFQRSLLQRKSGETLEVTVRRDSQELALQLTLASPPETSRPQTTQLAWELLGLELRPIPQQEFRERFQTRYRGGLLVINVRPDSAAAQQGIRPGDVLVGMHIWETVTLENVAYILRRPDLATFSPVKFFVLRNNETLYGYFPMTLKTAQR